MPSCPPSRRPQTTSCARLVKGEDAIRSVYNLARALQTRGECWPALRSDEGSGCGRSKVAYLLENYEKEPYPYTKPVLIGKHKAAIITCSDSRKLGVGREMIIGNCCGGRREGSDHRHRHRPILCLVLYPNWCLFRVRLSLSTPCVMNPLSALETTTRMPPQAFWMNWVLPFPWGSRKGYTRPMKVSFFFRPRPGLPHLSLSKTMIERTGVVEASSCGGTSFEATADVEDVKSCVFVEVARDECSGEDLVSNTILSFVGG